jgi:hypothetical protein
MLALDVMLAAAVQAAVAPAAPPGGAPAPVPNVEVVGPNRQNRVICRTIIPSGSHIAARRVCRTFAQAEAERDRMQSEAERAYETTMRRTEQMLVSSGYMKGAARPQ